jgi:putative two-component system response regulator
LGDEDLQTLRRGGFLHDIGMLAIPDSVLRKRGTLEPEEFELVKSHTLIGDNLCAHLRSLQSARPIVRHHHERLDGSGYPDGLKGDEIPLLAEIIGLVGAYDAITSDRPYQSAQQNSGAIEILQEQVRRGWRRAELTDRFVAMIESGELELYRSADAIAEKAPH